jgi:hypothetical protein
MIRLYKRDNKGGRADYDKAVPYERVSLQQLGAAP